MTNEPITLEGLEKRLAMIRQSREALNEEESLITKLVQLKKSQLNGFAETADNSSIERVSRSYRSQTLLDAVVMFLRKVSNEARSGEIQTYLEENGHLEKGYLSNQSRISHLLKDECDNPQGKIVKVSHGVFALRK